MFISLKLQKSPKKTYAMAAKNINIKLFISIYV